MIAAGWEWKLLTPEILGYLSYLLALWLEDVRAHRALWKAKEEKRR